jgi:hypothetical protein
VNFKLKLVKRDNEDHFIVGKGEIYQEEIKIIYLYATNVNTPNFIKHTLKDFKLHIDPNMVVMGNFNNPLSTTDRLFRPKKINKEI